MDDGCLAMNMTFAANCNATSNANFESLLTVGPPIDCIQMLIGGQLPSPASAQRPLDGTFRLPSQIQSQSELGVGEVLHLQEVFES